MTGRLSDSKPLSSPRKETGSPIGKKNRLSELKTGLLKSIVAAKEDILSSPDKRAAKLQEKDKENAPCSPVSIRRGSVVTKPRPPMESESGKMFMRMSVNHKLPKGNNDDKVVYAVVSVMRVQLMSSPVDYSENLTFDEVFCFDVIGTFDVKIAVFLQTKEKKEHYETAECLGSLEFKGLSVMPVNNLKSEYYLTKDGEDTTTSLTLQLAFKPQEPDDIDRSMHPEPDLAGSLSYQVPNASGTTYSWSMGDCELRGRTIRFYEDNRMKKILRMDPKSKAQKPDTSESEITLPYNCFQILVGGSPVYLLAQSKDEMKQWIEKLNRADEGVF